MSGDGDGTAADSGRRRSVEVPGFSHVNPVPAACRIGPFVFSGILTGRDPETGLMPADLDAQCRNLFRHVASVVTAAGGGTGDIARLVVWLRDPSDRAALNREWLAVFPDPGDRPARYALPWPGEDAALVRAEFVAVLDGGR